MCKGVKLFFLDFCFDIPHKENINVITLPNLLSLAAMKAYDLGRRSKWKGYLYFIYKSHYSLEQVCLQATILFGELFSEKLFRGQLSYFVGISFEEQVDFMTGFEVPEHEVKDFLIEV